LLCGRERRAASPPRSITHFCPPGAWHPTISARLAGLGLNQAALDLGRVKLDTALNCQRHPNTSRASYHDTVDRATESAAALKTGMTGISATPAASPPVCPTPSRAFNSTAA